MDQPDKDLEAFALPPTQLRGHWDNFIHNLGYGGTCWESGSAFLSQDLGKGN